MQADSNQAVWKQVTLYLMTLGILFLCALIIRPFLSSVVGAVVLAVATQRPYIWLHLRLKSRAFAAAILLMLVILSIIVPGAFLVRHLGKQAMAVVSSLRSDETQDKIGDLLDRHPSVAYRIETASETIDLKQAARTTASYIGSRLGGWLGDSVGIITRLVIMLFILFFLYRDHEQATTFAQSLLPLSSEEAKDLLARVRDTIYATALGRLVIAGVQGILAGLAFWILGVPSPIFWAFLTIVLAMIPAFGAVLVWAPIAIYLGLHGHWGKAALLAVWGGIIVSTIDNILYPILVGSQIRHHTAVILLSILGGIAVFGIPGLIVGPVIFTIAATLLEFWRIRINHSSQPA